MTNPSSQSRNGELIAKLQKHISPDRDALLMEVGKISEVMPEKMAKWFVMVDDLLRECLTALQSAAHSETRHREDPQILNAARRYEFLKQHHLKELLALFDTTDTSDVGLDYAVDRDIERCQW